MSRSTELIAETQLRTMMSYAAALELEVDRLRRRDQFLQKEARDHLRRTATVCDDREHDRANAIAAVMETCQAFGALLQDIYEPPGYHPSFDQVVAIAVRPLAEHVFRWHQRLNGAENAVLRLDLQPDSIDWFPVRFRHILDNLISNSLRYRDADKGEIRVGLQLRNTAAGYELQFTDNGLGIPHDKAASMLQLFYRAATPRGAGLGVGLAAVQLLVEQCCGSIDVTSGEGRGTSITLILPRFSFNDHLE